MPVLVNQSSGQAENLPQDAAAQALASGSHEIPLNDPDGNPTTAPTQLDAQQLLSQGYTQPSQDQLAQMMRVAKYTTPAQKLRAFGEGMARSATYGLSDQFQVNTLNQNPEDIKARKELNSISSGAGEALGLIAPLAIPGAGEVEGVAEARSLYEAAMAGGDAAEIASTKSALGAAQAAAKEAGPTFTSSDLINPVSAVSKASRMFADAATPEIGGTLGQILSKATNLGLGSSLELGAYGLGQQISADALGDPDALGEKLASHVGWQMLLGGGLGASLGIASELIPKGLEAAQSAFSSVEKNASGELEASVGPIGKAYARASSFFSGKPYESIVDAMKNRALLASGPEEIAKLAENFHGSLDELHDSVSTLLKNANKDLRPEEIAKLVEGVSPELASNTWIDSLSKVEDAIKTMRAEPGIYPEGIARKMELLLEGAQKKITSESTPGDIFTELNGLKQDIGDQISKYGGNISSQEKDAISLVRGVNNGLKTTLENQNIWGEAGARQAAFNDAQSRFFNLTGKSGLFRKYFMDKVPTRSGGVAYEISPGKIQTFLKNQATLRGDEKAAILDQYLQSSKNVVDQIGETYKNLPEKSFDRDAIDSYLNKTQEASNKAKQQAAFQKNMNMLGGGGHNVNLAEGAAGAVGVFHPVIGAGIEAFNMLKNPALAIQRGAAIERAAQKVTQGITQGSKAIFSGVEKYSLPIASSINLDDFNKRQLAIAKYSDPQKMFDALHESTASIYPAAPKVSQGAQQAAVRAVSFLNSKLPQMPQSLPLSKPLSPSKSDIQTFNRYYDTVQDPVGVLKSVASGTITPEQTEALGAVTPKLYQEMQQSVMNELINAKSKNIEIPQAKKMALSLFLGQDLDDSLEQPLIAQNQMAMAMPEQNQASQGMAKLNQAGLGKIDKGNRFLTPMQQTAQREA